MLYQKLRLLDLTGNASINVYLSTLTTVNLPLVLSSLAYLILENCHITDQSIENLCQFNLEKLKLLNLKNNNITFSGFGDILKALYYPPSQQTDELPTDILNRNQRLTIIVRKNPIPKFKIYELCRNILGNIESLKSGVTFLKLTIRHNEGEFRSDILDYIEGNYATE